MSLPARCVGPICAFVLAFLTACGGGTSGGTTSIASSVPATQSAIPSSSTAPASTAPASTAPASSVPVAASLDGGTHIWPNGVTLRLKVVRTERWGTLDDYCGDGSCGISHPYDLRWVLRFTVSVPATYPTVFTPASCPGELQVVNGNNKDAIIGVSGRYAKPIGDSILPGATKYGQDEYSIAKAALGGEFYIASSCGVPSPTFGSDASVVYFRGVIDRSGHTHPGAAAASTVTVPTTSVSGSLAVTLSCKVEQFSANDLRFYVDAGVAPYRGEAVVTFYERARGITFPVTATVTIARAGSTANWHQVPTVDVGASAQPDTCIATLP